MARILGGRWIKGPPVSTISIENSRKKKLWEVPAMFLRPKKIKERIARKASLSSHFPDFVSNLHYKMKIIISKLLRGNYSSMRLIKLLTSRFRNQLAADRIFRRSKDSTPELHFFSKSLSTPRKRSRSVKSRFRNDRFAPRTASKRSVSERRSRS